MATPGLSRSLFTQKEHDAIRQLIRDAQKQKADCNIVVEKDNVRKVSFEHDTLSHAETGTPLSVLMRLRIAGKEAMLKSNVLDPNLVQQAISVAKALPEKQGAPLGKQKRCKSLKPDKRLSSFQNSRLVDDSERVIDIFRSKGVIASAGGVTCVIESRLVASTAGVWHEDGISQYGVWASGVSKSKNSTYSDSISKMHDFTPDSFARQIAQKVLDFEQTVPLDSVPGFKKLPVIFTPGTVSGLLQHAFIDNLNAESVDKKRSLFVGKIGERLIGNITIIDDGILPQGVKTSGCDDEGSPRKRTVLFDKGTLKAFITDSNQAMKQGIPNTGNASLFGPDFTNMIIRPFGVLPEKAIVIDNIIGAHTSNSLTTDFSVKVENGYALLGKKIIPLKPFMISGKMLDFLKTATAVGKDIEERDGVYTGSIAGNCSIIP